MSNKLRRLVLAGLSLILIGGVLTPTVVQAATTDSANATASDSSDETTTKFDSLESPYNLVTDEKGNTTKNYWYPNATSQFYSAAEISADANFATTFPAGISPQPLLAANIADTMTTFANDGLTANLNESYIQYLYNPELFPGVADAAALSQFYILSAYYCAWTFKVAAQQKEGTIDYATAKQEYESSIKPLLKKINDVSGYDMTPQTESIFASEATFADQMPGFLETAKQSFLDHYSTEELAQLNPAATETANKKLISQPLNNFIEHQDGKVVANGLLVAQLTGGPLAYVFGDQPTTPTPSATSKPVTVHYVDEQGKTLKPDKTLTGSLGDAYKTEPLNIAGYKLVKTTGDESGKFTSSDQTVTYTYRKAAADVVVKNSVVYGMKTLSLYSSPTFTASARKATYAKKSRMNRPMFKIIGSATSKNGVRRYKVQALNGKRVTGYITAKTGYTAPLYYANKQNQVTVINPGGLNAYAKSNLSGKKTHYKQGQVLKVTQIVSHNLTTRFRLSNGKYISANKKLVIAGKVSMPKRVLTKTGINRYGTANLTKKNKHFAKGTTLKVTGWAYSNANKFGKGDTLRYRAAGGYITGNSRFVKSLK